jgi:hypothetical protein
MSWKLSSAVSDARMPILSRVRLTVKPGVSRSTRNIEIPWWRLSPLAAPTRAARKKMSAVAPFVMKSLEPLIT